MTLLVNYATEIISVGVSYNNIASEASPLLSKSILHRNNWKSVEVIVVNVLLLILKLNI